MSSNQARPKTVVSVLHLGSPAGMYGAERWILALTKYLSKDIVHSVVGVIKDDPSQDAPLCKHAEQLGFRSVVFESRGRLSVSSIRKIRQFLMQNHIDILHTHGYKTDLLGLLATIGTNCKIISTPRGWSSKDAGMKPSDVVEVILVGGSTRIPAIQETVKKIFGKGRACGNSFT